MADNLTKVKSLARAYTEKAVEVLGGIVSNGTNENARIMAATALLDRGWGKPTQPVSGEDGSAIQLEMVRRTIVDPRNTDSTSVPAAS